jgi:hypothetical protein
MRLHHRIEVPAGAWDALSRRALVPAAGAGHAWAGPLMKPLGGAVTIEAGEGDLAGLFLLTRRGIASGRLWPILSSARNPLIFSGLGAVSREFAAEVFATLFSQPGAAAVRFDGIPGTGPYFEAMDAGARACGSELLVLHRWERAALRTGKSFETWFEESFERKRRKEFRRLKARLGETGHLAFVERRQGDMLGPWIDDLIRLEAAGWKGRRGTALAADSQTLPLLRMALHQLAAAGRLRFWKLTLGGQPLAMLFAMTDGRQMWLGKIAYDEAFAKYSPGALLIIDVTEALLGAGDVDLVDSCAIPGHPMIDRIWRDRLPMCSVLVPAAGSAPWKRRQILLQEKLHGEARALARGLLRRLRKRRNS